ncbi:MAG: hypothetical protein AAFR35_13075 [Pseudomonadota bacterium]
MPPMMRFVIALAAMLAGIPATAETPMNAAEFEGYTTGKTLTYSEGGVAYGIEEYFPNRRVRWSFLDGQCQEGIWYPVGDLICFDYEEIETPQCWQFFERPGGLEAVFGADPSTTALYETQDSPEPMLCLGPEVGV